MAECLQMQGSKLYTAKQACWIIGLDDAALQVALDRKYVTATVVPQGERTYRRFTKDQVLSLWVFKRMPEDGIKPSIAALYLQKMNELLEIAPQVSGRLNVLRISRRHLHARLCT